MGTCMGRCLKKDIKRPYCSQKTMYFSGQDHVEFDFLVDDFKADEPAPKKSGGISYLLSLRHKEPVREVTLELTDDTWSREDVNPRLLDTSASRMQSYACSTSDNPFQPLDARSLLAAKLLQESAVPRTRSAASSTPPSSLDLEWEHEGGLPMHPLHFAPVTEDPCDSSTTNGPNGATATGPSSAAWSRLSTPDSLEWDPVEAPLAEVHHTGELDAETEQLLSEIERLTSRALKETGDWAS